MKTKNLTNKGRRGIFSVAMISALALVVSSCEMNDVTADEMVSAEPTMMEVLKSASADSDASAKKSSQAKKGSPAKTDASIAEIAIGAEFNELVGALGYVDEELNAGLVDLFLNGKDQYTVFAPTDEAFMGLYEVLEIDGITDLPAELVLDVLFYHVTDGRRGANSVVPKNKMRTIQTLLEVPFYVNSDGTIDAVGNSATIVAADISASNGIIHVIDAVILPIE